MPLYFNYTHLTIPHLNDVTNDNDAANNVNLFAPNKQVHPSNKS